MSRLVIKDEPSPIIHTPSFTKWQIPRSTVVQAIESLGLQPLYPGVHMWYRYTDQQGVAKLLPNLILKSSLYKQSTFTCINYAFKVWNEVASRFGLNTWVPVIGRIPNVSVRHAWNLILMGDETGLKTDQFLFFEPNDGWKMGELELAYQAFPLGEEGYSGEMVFF